MSLLSNVTKGKIQKPALVLIYGPDGIGKSSFAAAAPSPIFLGSEDGTSFLDVHRFPAITNYDQILEGIKELSTKDHPHKTLVIDSLDWLEPLVWKKVCETYGKNSIEEVGGGFGKGYVAANEEWRKVISALGELRDKKKMNIILIAHSQIKPFTDPQKNVVYDRYMLKLNEKAAAMHREFVDSVLFANYEVFVKGDTDKKVKAYGDGARVIYTERRPGFDAKNRAGLPFQIPLSWDEYQKASNSLPDPVTMKNAIVGMVNELKSEELKKTVMGFVETCGNDVTKLQSAINRLNIILEGEQK